MLRAYLGTRRWADDPAFAAVSVVDHVDATFPPSFVSAGNGDPLLPHSRSLAARLTDLGVEVDALFFAADRTPPLPHEYQFDLDDAAGAEAFSRMTGFLRARVG